MTSSRYNQSQSNNAIYAGNTGGYTTYPDPQLIQKMANQYQEAMLREQQKAYDEHLHAEREARFRQSMELLLHRMVQMESEVSQLTHRLSMAEAEVRQAKGREAKILPILRAFVVTSKAALPDEFYTTIHDITEELQDGQR